MSVNSGSTQSTQLPVLSASKSSDFESKPLLPLDAKIENRLTLRDLERLRRSFLIEGDGCHNQLSLTKDQFCEALSLLLKKGSEEEYAELFDKIDVMRQGSVTWDSLASHLLLEFYEKDDRVKSTQVPQWKDIKTLISPHKDTVQRVCFLKNTSRYIAVSKEGCVSWWSTDLKLQSSLKTCTETCKVQDLWATHCVALQNLNKVALAFTSKEISIYDMSSKLELNCQYKIQGLAFTPLCLDYWFNPNSANDAILVWGDVGGCINILFFSSANISLFERPPAPPGEKQEPCLNVQLKDIISGMYKSATFMKYEAHNVKNKGEWVRKVMFAHCLECFISCATTNANSLIIGWMEKHASVNQRDVQPMKKEVQQKFEFNVPQGISDFDFSERLNLIATAGINNQVCLWNPYVVSKPNGILRGHMASVVQVQFITSRSQLISFSKDKVLRIWDVQLQVCIQRLAGMFPKGPEVVSFLLFDDGKDRDGHERNRLIITFNNQITAMSMKSEVKDRTISHERPVIAALYNSVYNQMVSVCQSGTIIMWLIDTGQKAKQFSKAHGNSEVTCVTQDQSQTRLFTGSTDGTVKVWDFNGHCYHVLECSGGQPADVCQVLVLKRSVVVVGWAKFITVFRNNAFKDHRVTPSEWKGGQEHAEDILSCASTGPNTLATGSYDGEVIIWNTSSENAARHCVQRSRRGLKLREKSKTTLKSNETNHSSGNKLALSNQRAKYSAQSRIASNGSSKNKSATRSIVKQGSTEDQNDFGWAVVRLIFLENRRSDGVNLVSCGGNGWVRFWSASQAILVAEFVAHENVESIIMATDRNNDFIVTADVEGSVRVWEIQDYALIMTDETITNPPSMKAHFQPHQDQINSLEICERNDQLLIISASSDCSVALWDICGNRIGVFGQEEHWKIEPWLPSIEVKNEGKQQKTEDSVTDISIMNLEEELNNWQPDETATNEPKSYRINSWNKTVLGKDYQKRVHKRERKQPGTISGLPSLHGERAGALFTGPYSALATQELAPVENLVKPDAEKYFTPRQEMGKFGHTKLPALAETLITAFDEKSMFPSYILEFEKKMKQYHSTLLNQSQSKGRNELAGLHNLGTQVGQSDITKHGAAYKSSPSKGYLGLKLDPVHRIRNHSTSTAATSIAD